MVKTSRSIGNDFVMFCYRSDLLFEEDILSDSQYPLLSKEISWYGTQLSSTGKRVLFNGNDLFFEGNNL